MPEGVLLFFFFFFGKICDDAYGRKQDLKETYIWNKATFSASLFVYTYIKHNVCIKITLNKEFDFCLPNILDFLCFSSIL